MDQGFVKKNSEISVKEHVASVAKQLGDEITIRRFVRFQIGEAAIPSSGKCNVCNQVIRAY